VFHLGTAHNNANGIYHKKQTWDESGSKLMNNQDKTASRFCHQVSAWVPDMCSNFYLVKSHKIANNSLTTQAREKISTDLESLEF
jgi:hypothetical protein